MGSIMRKSLMIALAALNASLYAVCAYATAYIESPWGTGQFRPAIVIPALFATVFGPWVGGIGAAIGTLICDSMKHGCLYIPSLVAAVPANFVAFYLFGYILKKKFSWDRFVTTSVLILFIGNMLCAILLVAYYTFWVPRFAINGISDFILLSLGLTAWWFITMLPFQLTLTPPLIKLLSKAIPNVVPDEISKASLTSPIPMKKFTLALIVPGILMIVIGLLMIAFPSIGMALVGGLRSAELIASLIKAMFLITGAGAMLVGLGFLLALRLKVFT